MAELIRKTWAEILEGGFKTLWVTMDDDQKLKLVRYVKGFIGKTTSDGVRMTWDRFGSAVGSTGKALSEHYRRSEAKSTALRANGLTPAEASTVRSAKTVLRDRPEIIHELLSDPEIRRAVVDELSHKGETAVAREIAKVRSIGEEWHAWLNRLNGLLMDGAGLAERGGRLDAHALGARSFYERLTERRLDAEIRELFEREAAMD
jgi:hypothetical protein